MSNSYTECFYKDGKMLISDIEEYYETHKSLGKYQGELKCPECHIADLIYVHRPNNKSSYFRTLPSSKHSKDCSYDYEKVSNKTLSKYFDELPDDKVVEKVDSIFDKLFNEETKPLSESSVNKKNKTATSENPFLIPESSKIKTKKRLRRRSFKNWIKDEDLNDLFLFYGEVKLSVHELKRINSQGEPYTLHFLRVHIDEKNPKRYITSIYRTKFKDEIDTQRKYKIIVIGKVIKKNGFYNLELINKNPQALKYE